MSEQDNTRVVQQAYEAFGRGDVPGILAQVADNVDWEGVNGAGSRLPWGGRRSGKAAVQEFFTQLGRACDFPKFEPREYFAQGDKVVVLGYYEGHFKVNDGKFASEWAMVFTVRTGKIVKFREYTDSLGIVAAFQPVAVKK